MIVNGMATNRIALPELMRNVPARLLRFVQRVARLQPGRYVIIYTVSVDGDIEWQVTEPGKVER